MELIVEAERLAQLAQELQEQGHWRQAIDKHQQTAVVLDQIEQKVSDQAALEAIRLLSDHHKRLGIYIGKFLENKTLEKQAKDLKHLQYYNAMNHSAKDGLSAAFEELVMIADRVQTQLRRIEQERREADIRIDPSDLSYTPTASVVVIGNEDGNRSGRRKASLRDLERSNEELKKSLLYLEDENGKLRDVLTQFHMDYRENLFNLKSAIDLANIRGVSRHHSDEKNEGKHLLEGTSQLKEELEKERREKRKAMEQLSRLQKQVSLLRVQLDSEANQRKRLQRDLLQHQHRWDTIKKTARKRRENANDGAS